MTTTSEHANMKTGYVATEALSTAGCVSYWRLSSDVQLDALTKAWAAEGLDATLLPGPPKDEVALGRAVNDQSEKRILVRPLARRGAWAVVHEYVVPSSEGGHAKLQHKTIVNVFFRQGAPVIEQVEGTFAEFTQYHDKIHRAFVQHRNTVMHTDVSSWLLGMIQQRGSISLRESGGVYFVPRPAVAFWDHVASAVEKAGAGTIFRIPAMKTTEAVAAITDAITAEAEQIAAKMEEEIMVTGDEALGKRALTTRQEDAHALLMKLGAYEELLGQQLKIRERVTTLQAALTARIFAELDG